MYTKFMEEVITEKRPTREGSVSWKEKCSAISLGRRIPYKQKDPGAITISCTIKERTFKMVLIDSGASVSLMQLSIYHRMGIENVSDTRTNMKFADHSIKNAYGIAEVVLVTIGELSFPVDFMIIDILEDKETPIILSRPFMLTSRCNLDMDQSTLTLKVYDEEITLNVIENRKIDVEKEHHYQVGMIRIDMKRKSKIPTLGKDTRRPSQLPPPPLATANAKIPSSSPKAKRKKERPYPQG
ncbi:uncharacterized protein LOC127122629 [Lathyrus oleraceus]|uniref:uncharacterized protein LOC127122629 n=1 Tax=Pisum sativum TaxID=3888 RepID=UPI0021CF9B45|nr:uncharacterized protein LOC127122629 [Pisum sativum]